MDKGNVGALSSHLLLFNNPPKVLIARMLIEPSSSTRQYIVSRWLHYLTVVIVYKIMIDYFSLRTVCVCRIEVNWNQFSTNQEYHYALNGDEVIFVHLNF